MRIGVVILAGGEGRRIGGGKATKLLAGKSLVSHVLERVDAWRLPCAISVRDRASPRLPRLLKVLPDKQGGGPIAGVGSALDEAVGEAWDAVLTVPCDTPFLPLDLLARLSAALERGILAAVAASGGRVHPSCALWSVGAAGILPDYVMQRQSLIGFAEQAEAVKVEWSTVPFDPFFNVNSLDDLAEAERLIRNR